MTAKVLGMETPAMENERVNFDWKYIYRAGAVAAGLVVLAGLLDIFIIFLPGTGSTPGERTVLDWFALLNTRPFLALRDMGMLNMITVSCSVMVLFALYGMHRRINPLEASLALILVCMGAAIYIANNTALPMLTLNQHFWAATSEGQKALWAAAGQALLAQEDLTAGAYPGFFFGEIAGTLMAVVALRGGLFFRWEAWVGITAMGCLFIFNLCAAFIPALYNSVMPVFGAGGGILSLVWYGRIAHRLYQAR
jgi:hypothetical protein